MKLREITIRNFRCLVDVTIPIDDMTVLIGENNAGKTSLLDALTIMLTKNLSGRSNPFNEYDFHMSESGDTPQTSKGITIELWFREDNSDEWPEELVQALDEIVKLYDPINDLDCIGLRLFSVYDTDLGETIIDFTFLSHDGHPLQNSARFMPRFLQYVKLYYLTALRDTDDFFSPRSSFWGRILRDTQISDEERERIRQELGQINDALLKADPRLDQVREALESPQKMMGAGSAQKTIIRMLPAQLWDLLSKAEVAITTRGGMIEFPLDRHGQGTQSLSVLSLFQAYIDVYMKPQFEEETEAIITIEEPEAHLHPHATRTLSAYLRESSTQKIVSTHSPFFLEDIPLTQIRMFRRVGSASKVLYIKRSFSAYLPNRPQIVEFCEKRKPSQEDQEPKFTYQEHNEIFILRGIMDKEKEYRKLIELYSDNEDARKTLKALYEESRIYLSSEELANIEAYSINRIRGEIMFARAWLLCEGQSDYLLLTFFAEVLGTPLDRYGISLIDFQNNGAPDVFVKLARTFEIPWVMLCDNDDAGAKFVSSVKNVGFSDDEISDLIYRLPDEGMDIETYLVANGFFDDYITVFEKVAKSNAPHLPEWNFAKKRPKPSEQEEIHLIADKDGKYFVKKPDGSRCDENSSEFKKFARRAIIGEARHDKVGSAHRLVQHLRSRHAENPVTTPTLIAKVIKLIVSRAGQ